jgi:hypothetical protein
MGVDFIRRAAPTFKKSWDRQRVILATPTLLTKQPTCVARTVAADIVSGVTLQEGEYVTIQPNGDNLVALRGLSEVAHINDPPPDIFSAVQESYGIPRGTVAHINPIAEVADISLC